MFIFPLNDFSICMLNMYTDIYKKTGHLSVQIWLRDYGYVIHAMLNIFYPNLPQSLSSEPSLQSGIRLQRVVTSIHALPSSQRNSESGLQVKGST